MKDSSLILGISAYYHDSAACLIKDGNIVAAAQEERFTRKKHDAAFPANAISYCLQEENISLQDLSYIAFYEKPFIKFERLLETYIAFVPKGIQSFWKAMPIWLKEKLFLKDLIKKEMCKIGSIPRTDLPPILFNEHHEAHAASAFFPSPFKKAAILCLDGVGEWATTSAWTGEENRITPMWEIHFPHSLGLLYSAFTYYTGFKVNSGEYKVMGLAPYGTPKYVKKILDHLIDIKSDGTFRLNMDYFNYCAGLTMTNEKFNSLFGGPPRKPETPITRKEMDLASSIQSVTEEVVLRLVKSLQRETGEENLSLAGGVALNCVANGRVLREGPFKNIWIQPSSGDAGGALGAGLCVHHHYLNAPRRLKGKSDFMSGSYLGPAFTNEEIESFLKQIGAFYKKIDDNELFEMLATDLSAEKVVGWFQGRMEFGPRSLGGRSIIGDARSPKMQSVMNLKIKKRESFRPFAPSVLNEKAQDYFEIETDSPYMLLVASITGERRNKLTEDQSRLSGIDLLNVPKSDIPAVTHVDYSARIQTVHKETNPKFHQLLKAFEKKTGYGVVVNTSFNVRGEPIVCSPEDAYRCFMKTGMDVLVMENLVLNKSDQKPLEEDVDGGREFELD